MGSYFKPLRRKFGVVTLALACLLTAGWIKGQWQLDRICCWIDEKTGFSFCSTPIGISWTRCDIKTAEPFNRNPVGIRSLSLEYAPASGTQDVPPFRFIDDWDWQWCGFRKSVFGLSDVPPKPPLTEVYQVWVIPYWSIVVPLTLLSAWLLIDKVRMRNLPAESRAKSER